LLWDEKRHPHAQTKDLTLYQPDNYIARQVFCQFRSVRGEAGGSALRAVGFMAASAPLVAFADDDVEWGTGHAEEIVALAEKHKDGGAFYCHRIIRNPLNDSIIGLDEFESVGPDDSKRKVPYKMIDNNCLAVRRELAHGAAGLYATTEGYNDDRLMYAFLESAQVLIVGPMAHRIVQTCPERLIGHFENGCTR
jgi:hypothetical protein